MNTCHTSLPLDTVTPFLSEHPGAQAGKKANSLLRWFNSKGEHGSWNALVVEQLQANEMRIMNRIVALVTLTVSLAFPNAYAQQKPVDPKVIIELRAKAEKGDSEAQLSLGVSYSKGEGVPEDQVEAAKWVAYLLNRG